MIICDDINYSINFSLLMHKLLPSRGNIHPGLAPVMLNWTHNILFIIFVMHWSVYCQQFNDIFTGKCTFELYTLLSAVQ